MHSGLAEYRLIVVVVGLALCSGRWLAEAIASIPMAAMAAILKRVICLGADSAEGCAIEEILAAVVVVVSNIEEILAAAVAAVTHFQA